VLRLSNSGTTSFLVAHPLAILLRDSLAALQKQGANSHGQLGLGHFDDKAVPERVPEPCPRALSLAGGGGHTILIPEPKPDLDPEPGSTAIYTCGRNDHGQLGRSTLVAAIHSASDANALISGTPNNIFGRVPVRNRAVGAACGWDHSLLLLADGAVLSAGSNSHGQLGIGDKIPSSAAFVDVALPRGCVAVAAGVYNSVAVLETGRVLGWGDASKGQLGSAIPEGVRKVAIPTLIRGDFPESFRCVAAACGRHHIILLGDDRATIWAIGSNRFGQLGSSVATVRLHCLNAREWSADGSGKIRAIACGWDSSSVLLEDGSVYAWGRSSFGQLGMPTASPIIAEPTRLDLRNIVQVHAH
jgi:alpha-tubulin suppressor-like RCC1 family protein